MAMVAWQRRRFELGFLLLPVLYVLGIHALTTHFEPRYAYPVVPLLVLVFAITAQEVWSCFHDKRDRSRDGAVRRALKHDTSGDRRAMPHTRLLVNTAGSGFPPPRATRTTEQSS